MPEYNTETGIYTKSGYVDVMPKCNGYTFTNLGDAIAFVNDMVVYPSSTPATALGDSRSVGGNEGEVYKGILRVRFDVAGANPKLEIVQKFYL